MSIKNDKYHFKTILIDILRYSDTLGLTFTLCVWPFGRPYEYDTSN